MPNDNIHIHTMPNDDGLFHVPEDSAYYVRGAISRGFSSVRESIKAADRFLARFELPSSNPKHIRLDDEYAKELYDQTLGIKRYNEEWLREATNAIRQLHPRLIPSNIDSDSD